MTSNEKRDLEVWQANLIQLLEYYNRELEITVKTIKHIRKTINQIEILLRGAKNENNADNYIKTSREIAGRDPQGQRLHLVQL